MSGNDLAQIRSIKISSHDLMDIGPDGTYTKEVEKGVVLTITIEHGKVTKHEAKDSSGKSLQTSFLQMRPGITAQDEGQVCFICWQDSGGDYGGPGQVCGRMPCKYM